MTDLEPKLGQTVRTNEGRQGIIRYVGGLHIAPGDWLGLELPDASGKNDGSVKGERYFTCKPGYGIFIRTGAVVEILKQPTTSTTTKANGSAIAPSAAARPRPSSGISADVARKRQSLMSNGSGSAAASRLATRSPTKSPSKPVSANANSATSTPRTGTPTTAAKTTDPSQKSRLSMSGRPSLGAANTTTRATPHTSRPSIGNAGGLRSTTTSRAGAAPTRPAAPGARLAQHTRSTSGQGRSSLVSSSDSTRLTRTQQVRSPIINEEVEENETIRDTPGHDQGQKSSNSGQDQETQSPTVQQNQGKDDTTTANETTLRKLSTSRPGNTGGVETRTAQQREIEQLKAKIRTLEKKRQEDRDKLNVVDALQNDKDRFEGIIQALQKKLRTNQQELVDLRSKCQEAEERANAIPERSGELESELELATLDKEMAEERAEASQLELEAFKSKHEELELEVEILREENTELASTMSPEEKASAGWLQMERERERLRDALLRLRDMSQETESTLKAEIEELRENLEEAEKIVGVHGETVEKLTRSEETNKHLMGQLEAAESNDEVVEAMEIQREQHLNAIDQLKNQMQDLEEHIQVTDELENFHVDEEKRLHAQLDETEALLSESYRRSLEQDGIIEDLEYTLTKFRDVVQGLQSDIDEMRRSREISELQASEMSSKSRAMMDLNLRLQNNAAKTQTKVIDTELNKFDAELASKHAKILALFTPELFEPERKPILALLSFGRIKLKANLIGRILGERLRERPHLSNGEEIFKTFETIESMAWISQVCYRFEKFMQTCDPKAFEAFNSALAELEPVERTVTAWIEALRKDELVKDSAEHLKRMREILIDLSEKLIVDNFETKATEMIAQTRVVEDFADSLTGQFLAMVRMVQSKLGSPKSEDEESLVFDKRMDQLATKSRTVKYLSSKVVQQVDDLRSNSLCLVETSWVLFAEAEQAAELLTRQIHAVGLAVVEELSKLDPDDPVSYTSMNRVMLSALQPSLPSNGTASDDPFNFLSVRLSHLQSLVDELQTKSSDLNGSTEFETQPAPWIIRAKEVKNTKVISPEVQDELSRLERRNNELGNKMSERERIIEEMGMRVEIAEKRFKESKEKDNRDKALQDELDRLKSEQSANDRAIYDLRNELTTALQAAETTQTELEALRNSSTTGDPTASTTTGTLVPGTATVVDDSLIKQFELESDLLQAEIASLQSAIRYLRAENRSLRIPISEVLISSAQTSWLDNTIAQRRTTTSSSTHLEREATDVWTNLISVAKDMKPVRLTPIPKPSTHAPEQQQQQQQRNHRTQTPRYTVLSQRETLEQWEAWREDLLSRAKLVSSSSSTRPRPKPRPSKPSKTSSTIPAARINNVPTPAKKFQADDNDDDATILSKPVPTQADSAVRIVES